MNNDPYLIRTQEDGPVADWRESHPSYGMVGVSHATGNTHLFDSSVRHQHFICIRIKEAEKVGSFTHEYLHGKKELIEVWLSEAQFAQMISSPNRGDGVACTIRRCQGDKEYPGVRVGRPMPPEPEPFTSKYAVVTDDRLRMMAQALDEARDVADKMLTGESNATKANIRALRDKLASIDQNLQANIPYIQETMQEDLEKKVAIAAVEFEAYVANSLREKGLEALGGAPRLALSSPANDSTLTP